MEETSLEAMLAEQRPLPILVAPNLHRQLLHSGSYMVQNFIRRPHANVLLITMNEG